MPKFTLVAKCVRPEEGFSDRLFKQVLIDDLEEYPNLA
jgi:hypothetical protein